MSAYERWISEASERLRERLEAVGSDRADTEELVSLVQQLSLPGLLAFVGGEEGATGKSDHELLGLAARRMAEEPEFRNAGFTDSELEHLLARVLLQRERPTELLADAALRRRLLTRAVAYLAQEQGVVVSPEEGQRIAELLDSGEFFRDVGAATAAVLSTVRGIPIALVDDAKSSWRHVVMLPFAALRDLGGAPATALAVVTDLLDGTLDHPPAVMSHTLRELYSFASLRSTLAMLRELIAPENETVRLAVILYARLHGIQLTPADLDRLRASAFNPDDPSLGPLLAAAWERLVAREGTGRAREVLARLGARGTGA